jgi:predicted MPP superfamily phosphohydrolase
LGPFWVLWNFFIMLNTLFLLLLGFIWLITLAWWGGPSFWAFAQVPFNAFLGILGFIILEGYFQNLLLVRLERIQIPIPHLPKEFNGLKIAMVSDLHVGLFSRLSRLRQFSRAALKENPDLFVVCGDITDDDPFYIPKFLKGLDPLPESLPKFGILGNHDIHADPVRTLEALQGSRVRMLVNEGLEIKRGGASIWLAGVGDQGARPVNHSGDFPPDFDKALQGKPAGIPAVLLAHQPQSIREASQRGVELTLSGHTHGGQFGFKALKWSLAKPLLKYDMGLFQEGKSRLYVTTGTGYWVLPVRFGLSPEVSLIELIPE